jgi:RNA polymerase sigma factor (sigma-70 family)
MLGAVAPAIETAARRSTTFNGDHDVDDLCQQAAAVILQHAVPLFDPAVSTWYTYTRWWIRSGCWNLADRNRIVRVPAGRIEAARRDQDFDELERLRGLSMNVVRLDTEVGDGTITLYDRLDVLDGDEGTDDPDTAYAYREQMALTIAATCDIDPRGQYAVLLRLTGASFEGVGDAFGLSRQRAKQIEHGARQALKLVAVQRLRVVVGECPVVLTRPRRRCSESPTALGLCARHLEDLEDMAGVQAQHRLTPEAPRRRRRQAG